MLHYKEHNNKKDKTRDIKGNQVVYFYLDPDGGKSEAGIANSARVNQWSCSIEY